METEDTMDQRLTIRLSDDDVKKLNVLQIELDAKTKSKLLRFLIQRLYKNIKNRQRHAFENEEEYL